MKTFKGVAAKLMKAPHEDGLFFMVGHWISKSCLKEVQLVKMKRIWGFIANFNIVNFWMPTNRSMRSYHGSMSYRIVSRHSQSLIIHQTVL